jgi:Uma2 family endonuclease
MAEIMIKAINEKYSVIGDTKMEYTYEMRADSLDNVCMNDNILQYDTYKDSDDADESNSHFTTPPELKEIDYDSLITEDDTPVDNFYCEKQLRLLPGSLQTSWDRKEPYIAVADVGIYDFNSLTPIVPDVFLSLDVQYASDIWLKKNRCYMMNIFKKPPELVIEIVSNKVGGENTSKVTKYQKMGVKYYVIFDPLAHILPSTFCVYKLVKGSYVLMPLTNKQIWFNDLNVGLRVVHGDYEQMTADWLRWCDASGNILLTGLEKSEIEKQRADEEKQRADDEKQRADDEKQRADDEKRRADALAHELAKLKAELSNKDNKILVDQ